VKKLAITLLIALSGLIGLAIYTSIERLLNIG